MNWADPSCCCCCLLICDFVCDYEWWGWGVTTYSELPRGNGPQFLLVIPVEEILEAFHLCCHVPSVRVLWPSRKKRPPFQAWRHCKIVRFLFPLPANFLLWEGCLLPVPDKLNWNLGIKSSLYRAQLLPPLPNAESIVRSHSAAIWKSTAESIFVWLSGVEVMKVNVNPMCPFREVMHFLFGLYWPSVLVGVEKIEAGKGKVHSRRKRVSFYGTWEQMQSWRVKHLSKLSNIKFTYGMQSDTVVKYSGCFVRWQITR